MLQFKSFISRKILSYTLVTAFFFCCTYESLPLNCVISISKFPNDRAAAVSYTFDDNCESSFSIIAPLFIQYGFRATFFIISGYLQSDSQWHRWRKLRDLGFEIGNHTMNHPNLTTIKNESELEAEINSSYDLIQEKIGKPPFSFAHPYHATNDSVDQLIMRKHYATRLSPKGFCEWWGVITASTKKALIRHMKNSVREHNWFVIAAHGVTDGVYPIDKDFLESGLRFLKENSENIFVGTFEDLAKYKIEKENTILTFHENDGKLRIQAKSSLDREIFNYPLTLVVNNARHYGSRVTALDNAAINVTHVHDKLMINLPINSIIELEKDEVSRHP